MDPKFLLLILLVVSVSASPVLATHIMVTGSVFCDVCYNNSFTKLSYFLPGVDVHVQCKFQVNAATTMEQMMFSVNRTTDRYGVYRLDIPSADGVDCVEEAIHSFCQATLIGGSSVPGCNVPAVSATSKQIKLKSRSTSNLCVYSLTTLTYRPVNNNFTICANHQGDLNFNSSKFFLPYFPWPQFPPLPPLPSLPPFPPLPSLPPLPPFPSLPPLPQFPPFPPFQFPPLPSLPPLPPFQSPPQSPLPQPPSLPNFPPFSRPPADPRTLIPNNPSPPPPFNPSDPRTWIPRNPFFVPPPSPPGFDLRDPTTWIPTFPPSTQIHQP